MAMFGNLNKQMLFVLGWLLICAPVFAQVAPSDTDPLPKAEQASELREQAAQAAQSGDFDSAYSLIQQAMDVAPDDPKVIMDRIVILAWMERYDEAVKSYEGHSGLDFPDYALQEIAKAHREIGRHEKAVTLADAYLLKFPPNYDVLRGAIYSLIETKQYAKAAAKLQTAEDKGYQQAETDSLKALLYATQKRFDEVLGLAEKSKSSKNPIVQKHWDDAYYLIYDEAIFRAREDKYDEALAMLEQLKANGYSNPKMEMDWIIIYVWQGKFDVAVKRYQKIPTNDPLPPYFLKEIARAYNEIDGSVELKGKHWDYIEPYVRSAEALEATRAEKLDEIRSVVEDGQLDEGLKMVDTFLQDNPKEKEALFLKGEIYDKREEYWMAIQVYNQILALYPDNRQAFNLKLRTLMDLGATSLVVEESEAHPDLVDPTIAERARTDVPMHQIRWEEPDSALGKLDELEQEYLKYISEDKPNKDFVENYWRVKWDKILAMRQQNRMKEIIHEYETLVEKGEKEIPPWVERAAGDAYLYEQRPEEALVLFEKLVKDDPSFDLEMSVYYTLVELGRYKDAEVVLNRVDAKTPAKIVERGIMQDNFRKADVAFNKAWLMMYQDKLNEAEKYIADVKKISPFNTNLRSAEGHVHLYRGWKRKAMDDFNMIRTIDDKLISAHIGYAAALNENMEKKKAREEIAKVLVKKPKNKHAQRLKRQFDVEEMTTVTLSARYSTESPGSDEYTVVLRGDQPVGYHHTLFAETTFREETQEGGNEIARKIVVGDQWQIDNTWRLTGAVTGDYEGKGNVGYLAGIRMQPDDYWTFDFLTESDTLDISSRSRQNSVTADLYNLSTTFRLNELFNTAFGVTYKNFSDNNAYFNYLWRTNSQLYTEAYWKFRLGTEFSYEIFSEQNVPYFSPEYIYSFYLIPQIEHTWFRQYDRAWVDRFYVGLGQQWQKSFGANNAGYIRYEQDHKFSDTKSLLIGVSYDLNYYDSDDVNSFVVYSTARFKF